MAPRFERGRQSRYSFDPDAELERRAGESSVGGLDSAGLNADEARDSARFDREAELRQFERSFRHEPSGGRQIRDRERDDRSSFYGRGGVGWAGPDSPTRRDSRRGHERHLGSRERSRDVRRRLEAVADHLRHEIERADDAQLEAILETAAEVLGGLNKALHDFERRNEAAWR